LALIFAGRLRVGKMRFPPRPKAKGASFFIVYEIGLVWQVIFPILPIHLCTEEL